MAKDTRDNFPPNVVQKVAERAAYFCSLPDCRSLTIGPHSDPSKSLRTGRAAHIRAAAEGGPRYDQNQTVEERKSIGNAIWVCAECSDRIDKDTTRYPVEKLIELKDRHEKWIRDRGMVPSLPEMSLTTLKGYVIPDVPVHVDLAAVEEQREQCLIIRNAAQIEISTIVASAQLPEPVLNHICKNRPAGIVVECTPVRPEMVASGSGSVIRTRYPLPTHILNIQIDRLPAGQEVDIRLLTSRRPWEEHDISFDTGMWADFAKPPNLMNYIDGSFQYPLHGTMHTRKLFAPITYEKDERKMWLDEVRDDYGDWKLITGSFWS